MWYDANKRLMIFEGVIEGGKVVGGYTLFPLTPHNCRLLRERKLPYVSPMYHYDWPIRPGWHAGDHQKAMAEFMVMYPHSFNLSDCGAQKTLSALWAADFIMQNEGGKTIIVAPLSALQDVWAETIFLDFMGRRKGVVLHGSADKRSELLSSDCDFYIINHDGPSVGAKAGGRKIVLTGFSRALADRTDIRVCIYDEASALKNATSMRSRIARHLFSTLPYVCAMTATPESQKPTDAYGPAKFVNNAHGKSFKQFQWETMEPPYEGAFKWLVRKEATERVAALLQPAIRVPNPPKISTQRRHAELSADQKRAYKEMKREAVLQLNSGKLTAANEAVLRSKLLQIACGAVYDEDHNVHTIDNGPRLGVLDSILDECRQQVLIFAPFTSVIGLLAAHLNKRDGCKFSVVTGGVSATKRSDIFTAFHQGKCNIIADPRCMAHALTLTEATACIWFAPADSVENYYQANRRIDRPGQELPCTAFQIYSTPTEREIYDRMKERGDLQGAMLKLLEEA